MTPEQEFDKWAENFQGLPSQRDCFLAGIARGRASGQQGAEGWPGLTGFIDMLYAAGWRSPGDAQHANVLKLYRRLTALAASPQITSSAEKTIADNLRSSAVSPVEIEIASPTAQPSDSAEEGGLEEACRIVLGRHPDLNEKEYRVARALLHRVQQEKLLPVEPSNSDART